MNSPVSGALQQRILLPRPLAEEINCLSNDQRRAVIYPSDAVLLAGRGAGKTRVLVAKAAFLTCAEIPPPQRVGCVTFGNQAAEEIRRRLRSLNPALTRTVTCSTLHSFCLSEILTPFRWSRGYAPITSRSVISLARSRIACGSKPMTGSAWLKISRWTEHRDIACRRTLFAGEPTSRFASDVVAAARTYDRMLLETGVPDFEAMVGAACSCCGSVHPSPVSLRLVSRGLLSTNIRIWDRCSTA